MTGTRSAPRCRKQAGCVRILHGLTVQPQADAQVVRVGNLVGSDQLGSDRRERVEGLAGHPLFARLVELPVAGGDVVADGVAADILEGSLPRNMPPLSADHHDELGLIVDLLAHSGQDDGRTMADQGGRVLAEEHRFRRYRHAALGRVVAIVQPDADDLAGSGTGASSVRWRDRGERRRSAGRPRPDAASLVPAPEAAYGRGHLRIGRVDINVFTIDHAAGSRTFFARYGHPSHIANHPPAVELDRSCNHEFTKRNHPDVTNLASDGATGIGAGWFAIRHGLRHLRAFKYLVELLFDGIQPCFESAQRNNL